VKVSEVRHLIDAGPLVAAFWPEDRWHTWSRVALDSLGAPVFTTETVFAEAAHHLKPRLDALLQFLTAIQAGYVRFAPVYPQHIVRVAELVAKFAPRMDAADASLVILSELHPRARLLTIDRADFTLYRRRDGRAVPCLMPPVP
jgi:predicted nucleic acid-binding protein